MDVLCVLAALGIGAPADDKPVMYEKHADIAYRTDKGADKERHALDVYTPKGKKDFPTVLFVHGGSWKSGDKNLYEVLGKSLANDGIEVTTSSSEVLAGYVKSEVVKWGKMVRESGARAE